jgi:hypothetical protein
MRSHLAIMLGALAVAIGTAPPAAAQVTVVNMIPKDQSGESHNDSEPSLAVNPANPQHMAGTAFTPAPSGIPNAPIYISTDGGQTWRLNYVLPGNHPDTGTGDINLRFGSTSNVLYAADLRKTVTASGAIERKLNILRTADFTSPIPMELLVERGPVDQPYVRAISAPDSSGAVTDRVYVSYGDTNPPGSQSATVEWSLDAATSPPPAGFPVAPQQPLRVDVRGSCEKLGPTVTAIHSAGRVYAAFFRWRAPCVTAPLQGDVTVVRDDNWASGSMPFVALKDPAAPAGDGNIGLRVAQQVPVPYGSALGNQRIGGQLSIAVDPSHQDKVCLAWAQGTGGPDFTIHVRCSKDGGATWSGDLRTVMPATNVRLAINSHGQIGFLYQKLAATVPVKSWETWLEVTGDDFATPPKALLLHRAPDDVAAGTAVLAGPLGDYNDLTAVGKDFYGAFSGNNTPDLANFPQGVSYQRHVDFAARRLLATDNTTTVEPSSDPFFFVDREPALPPCVRHPWLCETRPLMKLGKIRLKCLRPGCIVIDPLPQNCLVKFKCPGCAPGGQCPPYYNVFFDGLGDKWKVGLFDVDGKPVPHRQFKRGKTLIVSFRPGPEGFVGGRLGDYSFAFTMTSKGRVGTAYWVGTKIARSDHQYRPPTSGPGR